MDRISKLGDSLVNSAAKYPEDMSHPKNQQPPQIIEEIERQKVIRKKFQSLEDTARCMQEWKEKGNLDLKPFEEFVLGEISAHAQKYMEFMRTDPDYNLTHIDRGEGHKDEQRRLTNLLLFKLIRNFPITMKQYIEEPWTLTTLFLLTGLTQRSISTKVAVHFFLYGKSILTLGTEKHLKYVENAIALKDLGCFGLTELSHGSNVQGCLTNAIFDERRKNFVLYTPHERGVKFWIGNAAHTANMAVIAANLIVKGVDYGIHLFLVEIRDRVTHDLIPGVTVGDCGDKMGLNGVDNGFIAFRGLRVSRDALLNRITDVDENGNVTSRFEHKSQRFAVQLSALSDGRVKVSTMSCLVSIKAVCIALRFATVRRQFGKEKYKELPILEYPSIRNRLFPMLATALIPLFAARKTNNLWYQNHEKVLDPKNLEVKEIHGLISVMKPLTSNWCLVIMNECRKVMGGLGYSKYAEIPTMISDIHVMATWEGDNNVLLQQVSRFLLKGLQKLGSGSKIEYSSLKFLTEDGLEAEKITFKDSTVLNCPHFLHKLMKIRAKRSLLEAGAVLGGLFAQGLDQFESWNRAIPFDLDQASTYFGELFMYEEAMNQILACSSQKNKAFLLKLLAIFAIPRIKESFAVLSENLNSEAIKLMNEHLLALYEDIKYDAVLCLDGLLMEDEIVRSPFGCKAGNMYEQFLSSLLSQRDNFGKAPYWKEIVSARNGVKFDLL